MLSIILWTNK